MHRRRLKVVVPGFALGSLLAALAARGFPGGWILWLWTMAGPFAEPMAFTQYNVLRMTGFGVMLLAAIVAHPCRPNIVTGWITGIGLALWFLCGFANTYAAF